jgi:hypothetical protein
MAACGPKDHLGDMRAAGMRGALIYCADYR